ncbi:hypothetical protein AUC43_19800 [Hymenobacter sedentarius]|uniref:Uncharacterized protein n=1 Tax=Hymenobacter sedentarius TaxID=1411621 RepID=A0A0U4C824_9BACT|nr:hypothetical protein [Hymenobacter sedentarius]ALW87122.1 hypothetical protein AUC43_19800 [Hymenobacter sedentarius]
MANDLLNEQDMRTKKRSAGVGEIKDFDDAGLGPAFGQELDARLPLVGKVPAAAMAVGQRLPEPA